MPSSALMHSPFFQTDTSSDTNIVAQSLPKTNLLNYRDSTETKPIEEILNRQNKILSALNEITPILMGKLELTDVLQTVLWQAAKLTNTTDGYLYLVDENSQELVTEVVTGVFEKFKGYRLKKGTGLAGRVWETGQPFVIEDYHSWAGRSKDFDQEDFRSIIGVPLISGDAILGVIGLSNRESDRVFGEDDVELLTRFAQLATIALENANLHHRVQQELAARNEAEANARQFKTLLDQSNDAIYVIDLDTARYVDFNTKAYTSLGYTENELHRASVMDIAKHIPDLDAWQQRVDLVKSRSDGLIFETTYKRKDGSVFPAEVGARVLEYKGKNYLVAIVRNITERKQSEAVIETSEASLRRLTDNMLDVITEIDETGVIRYASPSHKWVLGADAESMIGHLIFERLHPDDAADALEIFSRAVANDVSPGLVAFRYQHNDGHYIWMEASPNILHDSEGHFAGAVLSSRDITKRKEIEAALRNNEQLYRLLADNASDVIWVNDMSLKPIYISPAIQKLRGFTVEEGLSQTIDQIIPATSISYTKRFFKQTLSKAKKMSLEQLRTEARTVELEMYRKDGSTIWTETQVSFLINEQGKLTGLLGVTRDISERHKAADQLRHINIELEERVKERTSELVAEIKERQRMEQALRESEERYALAMRGTNDGLWDWNLTTNEIYFSPRWKSMLGFSEDAKLNQLEDWFGRIHPDDVKQVQQAISQHVSGECQHFECEYQILNASQEYCWMLSRGLAVRNEQGVAIRIAGSQSDITQRKRVEEWLEHAALHDMLTGLPNRALFLDRLNQRIEQGKRHTDELFAILFMDLDRFKVINDSLGHVIGDNFLVSIARNVQSCLRPEDTFARMGGDEFAILLNNIHEVGDTARVTDRIQKRLAEASIQGAISRPTTASIGIVISNPSYQNSEDMLRDADSAMYRAKALGGGRFQTFDSEMHEKAITLLELEANLKKAITEHELRVYYQPIISVRNGQILGMEALLRWAHPARGVVLPSEFISVVEETGLIIPIGEFVLQTACKQIKSWQEAGHPDLWVSVNISGRQFQDRNLHTMISQALAQTGLSGKNLRLEITESIAMKDLDHSVKVLKEFAEMGIEVLLDDFGIGHSSLNYLKQLPIHGLKIDRSFVQDLGVNQSSEAIIAAIISLGHTLDRMIVAEGVENERQFAFLNSKFCDEAQGFLFGKAIPAEEFFDKLQNMNSFANLQGI